MINLNGYSLTLISILLIGIALSMDAFAVGLSCGITKKDLIFIIHLKSLFLLAFFSLGWFLLDI